MDVGRLLACMSIAKATFLSCFFTFFTIEVLREQALCYEGIVLIRSRSSSLYHAASMGDRDILDRKPKENRRYGNAPRKHVKSNRSEHSEGSHTKIQTSNETERTTSQFPHPDAPI